MDKFTDQYFTYRETPVDYDGVGNISRIKGRTLVWNQQIQGGDFSDATTWYKANVTLSVSNNIGTITKNAGISAGTGYIQQPALPLKVGHKYLWSIDYACSTPTTVRLIDTQENDLTVADTSWHTIKKIKTYASLPSEKAIVWIRVNPSESISVQVKNFVCFDLTAMGLDITDPSEFTSLFSLPYYQYDIGSLLSFNGTGIKTVGFNQWDEEWESGAINLATGQKQNNSLTIRSKNYIPVVGGKEYYVKNDGISSVSAMVAFWYNGNNEFISYSYCGNTSINAPQNAMYMLFYNGSIYGTTYNNNICINISSSKNGEYEPYTENTTSLPTLTYFPTGMKSAGSVYDELTPSKAITRVGELVFDGVHNNIWSGTAVTNNVRRFYTTPVFKANVKVLADKLTDGNASTLNSIFGTSDGRIVITPSGVQSLTTVAELQTWLSSNPLDVYYELATESEQDINTKMLYPIYADGTEQILPTSDTSPFFGDIEYYNGTEGESNIRKFWLINGENERWDLTEKEFKAFLNNPQGLGFRKTVESVRYGERQNKVSETYNFPQPQGELLFYDSYNSTRYDKYNKFIRFLMNQPITLYYMIPVSYISGIANIYTLDCEVTEVQKTESKTDNILRSSIVFNGMEFYKGDPITVNGTGTSYTLTNDGDFPVGFEITVEGNLTNPYVTLEQDGELYGEAKFDSETAFSSVYVNSNDGEQNVVLMQNDAIIPNPLSYQDLSISNGSIYVTFVKLARGENALTIGMDSGSITGVTITFTPKYRSV